VGLVFLLTSRVVELLFLRLDSVEASLPLAFLGYGGFLCGFLCFFFFSFVWQDCSSQVVFFGGVAEPSCRRRDDFWPVLSLFSSDFGSQIYTSSLTSN
jgi:hypothetical protein